VKCEDSTLCMPGQHETSTKHPLSLETRENPPFSYRRHRRAKSALTSMLTGVLKNHAPTYIDFNRGRVGLSGSHRGDGAGGMPGEVLDGVAKDVGEDSI